MKLDDAVFNWLQMKCVAEQRPDDIPAAETQQFFESILAEDFKVHELKVQTVEPLYVVSFLQNGEVVEKQFPIEFVRQLLHEIEAEPKYNE